MHTSRLPNRPGSSHSTDPNAHIRYDTILKADALLATLSVVRSDALIFQDAIDGYTEPDPPEASQSTKTIPSFQAAYENAVARFRQAHVELTQTVQDVMNHLEVDERQSKASGLEGDHDLADEANSARVDLPIQGVGVDARHASGHSDGKFHVGLDPLSPAGSSSTAVPQHTDTDVFYNLENVAAHSEKPQTGLREFDPYAETLGERQARYESWLSLHPGLRAAAQHSHSRETKQKNLPKDSGTQAEPKCQHPACKEARKYDDVQEDMSTTPDTNITPETRRNKNHSGRKVVGDRQPQDLMQIFRQNESKDVVLPQPRTVSPTLNEASLLPNRISTARRKGKWKEKTRETERSYHPPFSGPGSHLCYGTLRGGAAVRPPDINPILTHLTPSLSPQKSFTEALVEACVRETDAEVEFPRRASGVPRVSGHGLPPKCTVGSNFRSEARGACESNNRTDQELFAERAAWQRAETMRGAGHGGGRGRKFP